MRNLEKEEGMRVLMTADAIGGVWTYALELMAALRESGVRFALATMGRALRPDQREAVKALDQVEVFESDYKLEWMEAPWEDVAKAGRWLLDLERRWRPDLVHLNQYSHGSLPWSAPVLVVGHSCVYSWFAAVRGESPPPDWNEYRQRVRSGLESADLVVAPSRAMLSALYRHYGNRFEKTAVIANGRIPGRFQPADKFPYVFTAGRLWDEGKNIHLLDTISAELPWPVFAAGERTHPEGGEAKPTNLRCLGILPESKMADWLASASIYALPARYEPFGLSALEAAFAGCALVLADIPSLRETWNGAALFAPPDDPDSWRALLIGLAESPALLRNLAGLARHRAFAYASARMAEAYANVYGTLTPEGTLYEDRTVLSFASLGLESWKRPFPARLRNRASKTRTRRLRV